MIPMNAKTVGEWGCNSFTVVEGLGLFSQIRKIWQKRSGASVSVGMSLFLMALSISAITYGWPNQMWPLVINGAVLGLGFGVIALSLRKFKGYNRREEEFFFALLLSLLSMLLSHHLDRWYFVFSVGSVVALLLQPIEIWKRKSSGVVDVRLLWLFLASNTFWVIYAYAIQNWVLMALCPFYVAVLILTIVMWRIYRPRAVPEIFDIDTSCPAMTDDGQEYYCVDCDHPLVRTEGGRLFCATCNYQPSKQDVYLVRR